MCWSFHASVAFAVLGTGAAALESRRRRPAGRVALFAYFAFMEALQAAQYLVIDQCDSRLNQVRLRARRRRFEVFHFITFRIA